MSKFEKGSEKGRRRQKFWLKKRVLIEFYKETSSKHLLFEQALSKFGKGSEKGRRRNNYLQIKAFSSLHLKNKAEKLHLSEQALSRKRNPKKNFCVLYTTLNDFLEVSIFLLKK